jgi:isochorismate synthase
MLAEALRRARALGRPVLASVAEPIPPLDPLVAYAAAPQGTERVFWQHGGVAGTEPGYRAIAGLGTAHSMVYRSDTDGGGHAARGPGDQIRFKAVDAAWRALLDEAVIEFAGGDAPAWGAGPLLLGGFSFDPARPRIAEWEGFPDARFTLPRFAIATTGDACWLTANVLVDPDADLEALLQSIREERQTLLQPSGSAGILPVPGSAEHPLHRYAVASPGDHTLPTSLPTNDRQLTVQDVLPAAEWQAMVHRTVREIHEGRFTKVVLARQARATAAGEPFDVPGVLARLRQTYPASFVFAFTYPDGTGDRTFLGASPERLVWLHDRRVETSSLAGSIRRGATPEEDAQLGRDLLSNTKEREEHAIVAGMVRDALAPVCRDLSAPSDPILLRLSNVQHLFTPIHGVLSDGQTVLDLVERLHPTPAVGGFPRAAALAAIREREQLDRGWYAAPIGWLDRRGEGEFAVAIRSALLGAARREALLFAGCGIVADSDPAAEYAESRLKLQAILSALG